MRNSILLALIAIIAVPAFSEALPDAPAVSYSASSYSSSASVRSTRFVESKPLAHHFFDRGNNLRFAALAGLVAADGFTTQVALTGGGNFREMNPIARPFVKNGVAGQVAASSIGLGATTGTAYLLHKTGHHKLERLVLNAAIGVEGETVSSNAWYLLR
jgi:hypothetical protein